MSDTVETALLMRRMMVTGMSEPNAAAQPKAIDTAASVLRRWIGKSRR